MSDSEADEGELPVFTVETLLIYMGNDQKALTVVAKIVEDALASAYPSLDEATVALCEGRYTDAAQVLHGLRGSIGTLGTKRFVVASFALEVAIAEQRHDELASLFETTRAEFKLAMAHAHAWLAAHGGRATAE